MDIQAEKLSLIEWLAGVNDLKVIKQFKLLQESNLKKKKVVLSAAEKQAISIGLDSISKGKVKSNTEVAEHTRSKYPELFK